MAAHLRPRQAGVEVLMDAATGKFFRIDQRTGETSRCTANGGEMPRWHCGVSGIVDSQERKAVGLLRTERPIFDDTRLSKDYVGIPLKMQGYGHLPRPPVNVTAETGASVPAYLLRKPRAPAKVPQRDLVGRDSAHVPRVKRVRPTGSLAKASEAGMQLLSMNTFDTGEGEGAGASSGSRAGATAPSFGAGLKTQLAPSINLSSFTDERFAQLKDQRDVRSALARNRALALSEVPDALDVLKKARSTTKGRFPSKVGSAPFSAQEIRDREYARWCEANPTRAAEQASAQAAELRDIDRRRRDRYPVHFSQEEQKEQ